MLAWKNDAWIQDYNEIILGGLNGPQFSQLMGKDAEAINAGKKKAHEVVLPNIMPKIEA